MRDRRTADAIARIARRAAHAYRPAGAFAHRFAHGKLARDPLFSSLLEAGWLAASTRFVDLGCGQGLLARWIAAARDEPDLGWPDGWTRPGRIDRYVGIDRSSHEIARARIALPDAELRCMDLASLDATTLGSCDAVALFDVLHYLDEPVQARVLNAVREAIAPGGTLLLRVGDGSARRASRWSDAVDRTMCRLRGYPSRVARRPLPEWLALLDATGFMVDACRPDDDAKASGLRAFANVLVRARPRGPLA